MNEAKKFLTKKVGPLPAWGWILALVGGILLAIVIKRALGTGSSSDSSSDVADPADPGTPLLPSYPGGVGAIGLPGSGTTVTPAEPEPITDNNQWRSAALRFLVAAGTNPATADRALAKYLEGRRLSVEQQRLISTVLGSSLGLPPDPPPLAPPTRPPAGGGGGTVPPPNPNRPATKTEAVNRCTAGDNWPNMYADMFALGVSVNHPKLKVAGSLTPCGAGYVAWLIQNKGARPTPESTPPVTQPPRTPRPTEPAPMPAGGGRTEPAPLPAHVPGIGGTVPVPIPRPAPASKSPAPKKSTKANRGK